MARSNKFAVKEADFKLFLVLWNQRMKQPTPDIHARMAQWLEHCWNGKKKNMLLMAFRAGGKSTICGLFTAWLLYRNPDLRILVLAAESALASVVLSRVKVAEERGGYWWGNNIIQVCQKPYQFSCWNRSDPNFRKLQAVEETDLRFATALRIARRAAAGRLEDSVQGATHYHAKEVSPYWAKDATPVEIIGNHIFYKLQENA